MRLPAILALREMMIRMNLDAVMVSSYQNRLYATGFSAGDHGPAQPDGILLVGNDSGEILLTGRNELAWAQEESSCSDVRIMTQPWQLMVSKIARELGWHRIGVEDQALAYSAWVLLAGHMDDDTVLEPLGNLLQELRYVKWDDEQAQLARAAAVTDEAFASASRLIEPGMSEAAAANLVRIALLESGADGMAFEPIVAAGPNSARPHHRAGSRVIRQREPVIIDMGARVDGYAGDLTRTLWFGESDPFFETIYNLVLDAQDVAIAAIRPGVSGKNMDALARDRISAGGYGESFKHGLGHGLGIEVHEGPRLSAASIDKLEPGHVVTVEPGIYLEGWGGVRTEDVVLVTADGHRNLTASPKKRSHM